MTETNQPKKSHLRIKSRIIRIIAVIVDMIVIPLIVLNFSWVIQDERIVYIVVLLLAFNLSSWHFFYNRKYYVARREDLRKLYVMKNPDTKLSQLPNYSMETIDKRFKGECYIEGVTIPADYPEGWSDYTKRMLKNDDFKDVRLRGYDDEDQYEDDYDNGWED